MIIGRINIQNSVKCKSSNILERVENETVVSSLKGAIALLCELKVSLYSDNCIGYTEPSEHVKGMAKHLFDYLAATPELAVLDADGVDVKIQNPVAGYSSICNYGVYLTGACCAGSQVRYLVECGKGWRAWGMVLRSRRRDTFQGGNLVSFDLDGIPTVLAESTTCFTDLSVAEFVNGTFYGLEDGTLSLVSLDAEGNGNFIGFLTGIENGHMVTGMSHDRKTGKTYVMSTDLNESTLYELDLGSGMLTRPVTINDLNFVISLMICCTGDAYVIDVNTVKLHKINLNTGSLVGEPVLLELDSTYLQDYDFSCGPDGFIYGMVYDGVKGVLSKINPSTGEVISLNDLGNVEFGAFAIECV